MSQVFSYLENDQTGRNGVFVVKKVIDLTRNWNRNPFSFHKRHRI